MRTLVDLTEKQLDELAELAKRENRSRVSIIRDAVSAYLKSRKPESNGDAFGLWGDRKIDGLEYQKKLRSEW
ncbi:MAG TPA: ribbon-helix-helix protein, CopG family [Rhizomicrobium sp.]|jgi:metal-responsive CopG/Arc/MetJ family transcriptional regulator|nr:ribbon-helix-helix protein, CopG family [Rhizomicrobium sp.]